MTFATVAVTPGLGANVVTDTDGSGNHMQGFKALWGAQSTKTLVDVPSPLPVQNTLESSQASNLGTIVTPKFAAINVAASGDTTLVAAVTSKKIRVVSFAFVCDGTVAVYFRTGTGGTALTGAMSFIASTGIAPGFNQLGHFETGSGALLAINLSAAIGVRGFLTYLEIA